MVSLFQQGMRVMGVTCSTDKARFYTLKELPGNGFKCECKHLSPVFGTAETKMWCKIHVWQCPIWKPFLEQMMFEEKYNGGH